MALCERPAPVSGVEQPVRVAQYLAYEPYGGVIEAHTLHPHPPLHAGHKGLFADRLNAGVADSGGNELARLVPLADITYYVRNRTYSPRHGRWLQQDPNASAVVDVELMLMGSASVAHPGHIDLGARLADGGSLYGYVRCNPITGRDPLGLWMWGGPGDTLATGAAIFALTYAALETHRFVQEEATEWAGDWSRPDEEIQDFSALLQAVHSDVDNEVASIAGPFGPMIAQASALKIGQMAIKGFVFSGRVSKIFWSWFNRGPADVVVYLTKRNGKWYAGITSDIARRGMEHGQELEPLITGLTRNQARAVETAIIKRGGPALDNVIQSIADDHRFGKWAIEWGESIASRLKLPF